MITLYFDGKEVASASNVIYPSSFYDDSRYIGSCFCGGKFNGSVSNVQVYNLMLSANQIYALYPEGITGAPYR